ncbi:hypothetical protein ACSBR2_041743 [Camellia fascicularis]
MEACGMDGKTKKGGTVSGLTTVVNPISLSRLVMEKSPHIYLAFDGAEAFAREQGLKLWIEAISLLQKILRAENKAFPFTLELLSQEALI